MEHWKTVIDTCISIWVANREGTVPKPRRVLNETSLCQSLISCLLDYRNEMTWDKSSISYDGRRCQISSDSWNGQRIASKTICARSCFARRTFGWSIGITGQHWRSLTTYRPVDYFEYGKSIWLFQHIEFRGRLRGKVRRPSGSNLKLFWFLKYWISEARILPTSGRM